MSDGGTATAVRDAPGDDHGPGRVTGDALRHRLASVLRPRGLVDPVAIALAALSLIGSAVFVAVSLYYNQGRLIAPLDDVYIHLQYARQIGAGMLFQYQPGDPVSTGASSVLYALLLGGIAALGVDGTALLAAAVLLGALCVAATTVLVHLLGTRLVDRRTGAWAGVLTALCGPLLWGATSGMEVGPVALLVTGIVLAFVVEQPRARFVVTPVIGALLAITRPEGLILATVVTGGMLWAVAHRWWADRLPWPTVAARAGLAVAPQVAGALQLLVARLATGSTEANGSLAKSLLHQGTILQPMEVAEYTLRNLGQILASLTGLSGQDLVPPGTLAFVVLGLVALGSAGRRLTAVVLGAGLSLVLLAVCTLTTAQWQDLRYLQPVLPLVLLLAVIGVTAVGRAVGGAAGAWAGNGRTVTLGLLVVALVFSLVAVPTWALRLGQQATAIREGPVSIGTWLAGHLPPGTPVGVHDVGAVAYFGGRPTVDLVGLTTNGFTEPANQGAGTLYEAMRHLPPDRRPAYFSLFDDSPREPPMDLAGSRLLGDEPVITFELKAPARPVSATAPQPCEISRDCDRVSVWQADWTLAGSGDRPDLPVPGTVRDHLNVGDLDDEARHGWTAHPPVSGAQPVSRVDAVDVAPGRAVVDSGRRVVGGESFRLTGLEPGRPVVLTARVGTPPPVADVPAVTVDGVGAGEWDLAVDAERTWGQRSFVIPAELVRNPTITVELGPRQAFLGPYPDYVVYGYWASQ